MIIEAYIMMVVFSLHYSLQREYNKVVMVIVMLFLIITAHVKASMPRQFPYNC